MDATLGRREALQSIPLLAGMAPDALDRLAAGVAERLVQPGEEFIREGSPGREAYLIVDGEAEILIGGRSAGIRGAGTLVGEMTLLSYGPRCATVRTRSACRVFVIEVADFAEMLGTPAVARRIASLVVDRLRQAQGSPTWRAAT